MVQFGCWEGGGETVQKWGGLSSPSLLDKARDGADKAKQKIDELMHSENAQKVKESAQKLIQLGKDKLNWVTESEHFKKVCESVFKEVSPFKRFPPSAPQNEKHHFCVVEADQDGSVNSLFLWTHEGV